MLRLVTLLFVLISYSSWGQNLNSAVVSNKILEKIEQQPNAYHPILILLESQVNFPQLVNHFDEQQITVNERPKIVIETLQNNARNTQVDLLNFLENSPYVHQPSIRKYWIGNILFAEMKSEAIAQLSNRSDVAFLQLSGKLEQTAVEFTPAPPIPNGVEPGLEVVGAPFMWNLGYTGYGQLAFTNDTGIDPNHPTYASNYRGFYSDLNAVWFDFDITTMAAIPGAEPRDCNGHGTHVNGTVLGLDRRQNDTIGVAFNAQWIGSAILCGIGTADNVGSFEWSLNPDGDVNTSDDIPDIINNSWYDPSLDTLDCVSVYVPILEALEAANVAVIFSAGNEGPGTMTITQPHNINVNLVNTFTVGALNGNSTTLPIANFSSRGPSHCPAEGSLLIKPEVSAPGVSVRSARPNGEYGNLSGTSMASPHVSGCVLLLKEAFPELTAVELKEALYYSCIDLGNPGEDNTFGMGVINVENAYNYLLDLGHVPVSPFRENDILLIDFQTNDAGCENQISPVILVENAGTDSIFTFTITQEAGMISEEMTWEGTLAPNERAEIALNPLTIDAGEYALTVSLSNPNGVADERPLNNVIRKSIIVVERPFIEVTAVNETTVCEGSNALLMATSDEEVNAFLWYDEPFGGFPIAEGSLFLSEDLTQNKTYFASARYEDQVGEETLNLDNATQIDSIGTGLIFDAYTDFILKSIQVYAEESGVRQFNLRTGDDDPAGSKLQVLEAGWNDVELNFNVEKGKNYQLQRGLGKSLASSTAAANFPYEVEGVLAIKSGTDFPGADFYPMLYDWQIEYESPCARTAIELTVVPSTALPLAVINLDSDTLNLGVQNGEVQFFDNSSAATSWLWSFPDGTTSSDQNTSYEFTEIGDYSVILTVTNDEGCTHSVAQTITVIDEDPSNVRNELRENELVLVYPNPVQDVLHLDFQLQKGQLVNITLINPLGQSIVKTPKRWMLDDQLTWNVSDWSEGVYFLLFEIDGQVLTEKVVITK